MKPLPVIVSSFFAMLLASCGSEAVPDELATPSIEYLRAEVGVYEAVLSCSLTSSVNVTECGFLISSETPSKDIPCQLSQEGDFSATVMRLRQDTEYSYSAYYTNGKERIVSEEQTFRTDRLPYDPVLWEFILKSFDSDGDGALSDEEKGSARELVISDLPISSLSGIEELTSLERLFLGGNGLEVLDLTGLPSLELISCGRDPYRRIIFDNPKLYYIYIIGTSTLSALDTDSLPGLEMVDSYGNAFETLSFAKNPRLSHLTMEQSKVKELDFTANPDIRQLYLYGNPLLESVTLSSKYLPEDLEVDEHVQVIYK